MPLKTLVKVGNISNLSDARYCAGMGVDMIGICAVEGNRNYISPKLYQEIRGWISGPKVVAEIYGLKSSADIKPVLDAYAPDYFELSVTEYKRFQNDLPLPSIISVDKAQINRADLDSESDNIAYLIIDDDCFSSIRECTFPYPILLRTSSSNNLTERIEEPSIAGVALSGSPEERPGFKDYSALADILEVLEE